MIWSLLILFMLLPGGENQWIWLPSYKVIHPCDAQNISAIITSPKLGKYQYNLLMPLPSSYSHFIMKFDSPLILTCEPLVYIHAFFSLGNNTYHVETNEKSQLENNDRVMNCLIKIPNKSITIPYVQSIVLNEKHQLCQNPKNHYFDDFIKRKTTVTSNTASSTIPNALAEKPNVPVTVSSNKKEENNATHYSYFERLINQEKQFVETDGTEEKAIVPVVVSSTMPKKEEKKNATSQSYFERLIDQEKQFLETDVKGEKAIVPVIVSSTMPKKEEEKNATSKSYFERLIDQEKQFLETDVTEKKAIVPVVSSSTLPNVKEETNNDNEFQSTTIRNALLLSIVQNSEVTSPSVSQTCGTQKVLHTPLIVHGQASKAAHWPWHVALNRIENFSLRYICGGTLLSKTVVLTAAHCASIRGGAIIPELLRVDLGRHDLFGRDVGQQEREVFQVIIHPKFNATTLDNDIALLKLKSEAVFTDYVQPACLWYEEAIYKLPYKSIFGTVAGWGFDHQDSPSYILQQITIPLVPELTCLKSNPTVFHKLLNSNKFCAGFGNGTAVCNGDSGGGLMIFVTETPGGSTSGAWHVRGIVSVAPTRTDRNVCDPDQYTIFTDVEKYRDWVLGYFS